MSTGAAAGAAAGGVVWHDWGPQALAEAAARDVPLLLSFTHASCHWCHVMARETWADPAIAERVAAAVVAVRIDAQARPDLDDWYQAAHAVLARAPGGWPLTVFCSPDGTPFLSGTYYPPQAAGGLPAFADLLDSVGAAWRGRRADIARQDAALHAALRAREPGAWPQPLAIADLLDGPDGAPAAVPASADAPAAGASRARQALALLAGPLQAAAAQALLAQADGVHGGFASAPGFPCAPELAWLLERAVAQGDDAAGAAVRRTLTAMAEGGIADQLGGGFFRHTEDAAWRRPHFEKPLALNAQLLALYADAVSWTGEALYGRTVEHLVDWLQREMALDGGGWALALDADSPPLTAACQPPALGAPSQPLPVLQPPLAAGLAAGAARAASLDPDARAAPGTPERPEPPPPAGRPAAASLGAAAHGGLEGEAYLWEAAAVRAVLKPLEWDLASAHWNLLEPPDGPRGRIHLRVQRPTAALAAAFGQPQRAIDPIIAGVRRTLLAWRDARPQPARDAAFRIGPNALMVAGLLRAAAVAGREDWRASALAALRRVRAVAAERPCTLLDDQAAWLLAELAALQAGVAEVVDAARLRALADDLLARFEDAQDGGFFQVAHGRAGPGAPGVQRRKPLRDAAAPGPAALALRALERTGQLLDEPRWRVAVARGLCGAAPALARAPLGHATALAAALEQVHPLTRVLLRGPQAARWRDALAAAVLPHTLLVVLPEADPPVPATQAEAADVAVDAWPATWRALGAAPAGVTRAWVCHGHRCQPPLDALEPLATALGLQLQTAPAPPV